jgi:hypothetical protein
MNVLSGLCARNYGIPEVRESFVPAQFENHNPAKRTSDLPFAGLSGVFTAY